MSTQKIADRKCAHPECNVDVEVNVYACRSHWFSLPPRLREEIQTTWRRRQYSHWTAAHREAQTYWAKVPKQTEMNLTGG